MRFALRQNCLIRISQNVSPSLSETYLYSQFTCLIECHTATLFGQIVLECSTCGTASGHPKDKGTTYYLPSDKLSPPRTLESSAK